MSLDMSICVSTMSIFGDENSPEFILIGAFIGSVIILGCYQIFLKVFLEENSDNLQGEVSK